MLEGYFNHVSHVAEGWWDRRAFVRHWRRLNAPDRRWTPPYFPALHAALTPQRCAHLDRMHPLPLWLEAMPGQPNYTGQLSHRQLSGGLMEQSVGTALILADPRRRDGTGYLSLFSAANDVETLERFIGIALEQAMSHGIYRLVGPVGLSPHLAQGALLDHFDRSPPLYSPYNPPYLPEVLDAVLVPVQPARLYITDITDRLGAPAATARAGPAHLHALQPDDLAQRVPQLLAAWDSDPTFLAPDAEEAAFLISWWGRWPLTGWIAQVEGEAVGLMLLQADLAPALRLAKGGRNLLWRAWLHWRSRRRTVDGRVLALVVHPAWRRQGIGRQLWQAALMTGREARWRQISVGPVVDATPGASFLAAVGATPVQRYRLYATSE